MFTDQELSQLGQKYRRQFDDVDFVGEIELPEKELEILCGSLWKNIYRPGVSEDLRILLTVLVVNLAFYNREELDSNSFRWLILKKFSGRNLEDVQLWEDRFGYPVLQTLKKYFQAIDTPGPNRYVRPIMQQAGVSYSVKNQFADFLQQLVKRYGFEFSFRTYQTFLGSHQVASRALDNFLATETGWHYCREIGRIFKNLHLKILTYGEIYQMSPRFREMVRELDRRIKFTKTPALTQPEAAPPQLALDKYTQRLKLLFSEQAISSTAIKYYLEFDEPVYQSSYPLTPEDLSKNSIRGRCNRENWEVSIWNPLKTPWAVFSPSSGVFIKSGGVIEPGVYLIVVPDGVDFTCIEDYGYLSYPSEELFRVFHAELRSGQSIPEIDLLVSDQIEHRPQLNFLTTDSYQRFSTNTFVGKIPPIQITNWDQELSGRYLLLLDTQDEKIRIREDEIKDGRLDLSLDLPIKAQLSLEAKGKAARSFQKSDLSFTVLPESFRFDWNELLYGLHETPELKISPAEKIEIIHQNDSIEKIAKGRWQVFPRTELIELRLRFDDLVDFSLSVPVYRLIIESDVIKDQILWQENLDAGGELLISLSPNERKQNLELGLFIENKFIKISDTRLVPNNNLLRISTDEIRDAFEDCGIVTATIAVKTRTGSRIVHSDVTYANEKLIREKTLEDSDQEFNRWSRNLPDDLRSELEKIRKRHISQKRENEKLILDVPPVIKELIEDYQPDFEKIRGSVHLWVKACRRQQWQTAKNTEFGGQPSGRIVTDIVSKYHTALLALEDDKRSKYNRHLISVYHELNVIFPIENHGDGTLEGIAVFLRALCCLRLNEANRAEVEIGLLNKPRWKNILHILENKLGRQAVAATETPLPDEAFSIEDVILHERDFGYITNH
jgi:hypothetical protein